MVSQKRVRLFKPVFAFEAKRAVNKRNLVLGLVLTVLALLLLQDGINSYKSQFSGRNAFVEIEKEKVKQYIHYTQYGAYGFRYKLVSPPESVLFHDSGIADEITANIDVSERLSIYNNLKGKSLFALPGGIMDFSGIMMLFAALYGILYGYDAFRNREFIQYIDNFACGSNKKFFTSVVLSRCIILFVVFLVQCVIAGILVWINGLWIEPVILALILLKLFLFIGFFTLSGAVASFSKSQGRAIAVMIAVFALFIFFIPWAVNKLTQSKSSSLIDNYVVELKMLKELASFEKRFYSEVGVFKSGNPAPEKVKKLIQDYTQNEYKRIMGIEEQLEKEISQHIDGFQLISSFFPTTFYLNSCRELSGRGYLNFLDFYRASRKMKDSFFRFYIQKKYNKPTKKMELFIKNDENLFYASSRKPGYWILGLGVSIVYIFVLFLIGISRFDKCFHPSPEKKASSYEELKLEFEMGKIVSILYPDRDILAQLLNTFKGKPGPLGGKLTIDGTEIDSSLYKDFAFLPAPQKIKGDFKVCHLVALICGILRKPSSAILEFQSRLKEINIPWKKGFGALDFSAKGALLIGLVDVKKCKYWVFADFMDRIYGDAKIKISKMVEGLKKRDTLIINAKKTDGMQIAPDSIIFIVYKYETGRYFTSRQNVKNWL